MGQITIAQVDGWNIADGGVGVVPVPYPSGRSAAGTPIFAFRDLAEDLALIDEIPEVRNRSEWKQVLATINTSTSPLKSYGCQVWDSDIELRERRWRQTQGYVDLIFRDLVANWSKERYIELSHRIVRTYDFTKAQKCHLLCGIHSLPSLYGRPGAFGLHVRVSAIGNTREEAVATWSGASLALAATFDEFASPERRL